MALTTVRSSNVPVRRPAPGLDARRVACAGVVGFIIGLLVCAPGYYLQHLVRVAQALGHRQTTPRQTVKRAMAQRPADPWPRGMGHIILAIPGTREEEKAYHEPGGSFSPSVGSFGVSLWMMDGRGRLRSTSDSLPLGELRQQFVWQAASSRLPVVLTETAAYRIAWSSSGPGRWTADLEIPQRAEGWMAVVVRSIGPAGGPINALDWDQPVLRINHRWRLTLEPSPSAVFLGEEGGPGWTRTAATTGTTAQWEGKDGWGYVRLELPSGYHGRLSIEDSQMTATPEIPFQSSLATVDLELPDERFAASLHAQTAHLLMSLVGRQTRPGEPTNYPLAWLRDGAYVVVALARAGQLDVVRELSADLAERDFVGGFGSEADAPGLAIWALEEVAIRLQDPVYDRRIWPHVRRKADRILEMLSATQPIRQPFDGPLVPSQRDDPDASLVCQPSSGGLIIGRMDYGWPVLFVNAVSYRGLLDAAALAERVQAPEDARRWRAAAHDLQQTWTASFPRLENNPRTYISGIWPTWIAAAMTQRYLDQLETRWQAHTVSGELRETPLWTYFEVAEGHQWLLLGHPERSWETLRYFWDHQASPGLYTWWEGEGGQDTFNRWEQVRGWVHPPHVTPHYWTAAEIVLLQLDMLAYADEATEEPTLVVGAGVLPAWLTQPLRVRGVSTRLGEVDWTWDGQRMHVVVHGRRCRVRLGTAFRQDTPMDVNYRGGSA